MVRLDMVKLIDIFRVLGCMGCKADGKVRYY